jgi:hypothetical protein
MCLHLLAALLEKEHIASSIRAGSDPFVKQATESEKELSVLRQAFKEELS